MKRILHLGCGPILIQSPHAEWVNVDKDGWHEPDVVLDCKDLASHFGAQSFSGFSSTHMLEHLSYPVDAQDCLNQIHQVLAPGSVARIMVPDLELIAKAYANGSDLKFIYGTEGQWHYGREDSRAERFHFFMTAWEHRMVYDFDLLSVMMKDAGFHDIQRMPINQSRDPELAGKDRYLSESLIVEGIA